MDIKIGQIGDLDTIIQIYNRAVAAGQRTADITPFTVDQRKRCFIDHISHKYKIIVAEREMHGYMYY